MRDQRWKEQTQHLISLLLAVLLSFILGGLALILARLNPFFVYTRLVSGIFSRPQFMAWSIIYATPMILTGLAVAFAFRAGLFNIGADGQFIMGTVAAVTAGYFLKLPAFIHIPVTLLAGMLGGALWASIAGYLKVMYRVHEVVVTIMLNWVALYLCNFFTLLPKVNRPMAEVSYDIQATASLQIKFLGQWLGQSTRVNWGIVIAILLGFVLNFLLNRTTFGFKLRAIGLNHHAALAAGMPMARMQFFAMAISGALAGLGGAIHIMGVLGHTVVSSMSDGHGFDGIAVALIGLGQPLGVVVAGLFYGALKYSAGKLTSTGIPGELIHIIMGCTIYFIAISVVFQRVALYFQRKDSQKKLTDSVEAV